MHVNFLYDIGVHLHVLMFILLFWYFQCVHMPLSTRGSKFRRGGYRCECLKGHEYLFENDTWYFDGEMMEREYNRKSEGLDNR